MSDANPYESPAAPAPASPTAAPATSDEGSTLRFAHLGLRLMGVYLVVEGLCNVVGSIVHLTLNSTAVQTQGYEADTVAFDAYGFGWLATSVAIDFAGLYFVTDGRGVLHAVFLPAPPRESP